MSDILLKNMLRIARQNPEIRDLVKPHIVQLAKKAGWAGSGYGGTLSPATLDGGKGAALLAAGREDEIRGWDKYVMLVAQAFKRSPSVTAEGVKAFEILERHIVKMFNRMQSKVKIEFVEYDPYESAEQMDEEVARTGVLKIMSLYNQATAWSSPQVNLMLRGVHDFAAHLGANPGGDRPVMRFTAKGELKAYNKHARLMGKSKGTGALFTEIVGQAAYFTFYGEFPDQKVILMNDFDWHKIGKVKGYKIVDMDLVKR